MLFINKSKEEHEIRTADTSCVDIYLVYTKDSWTSCYGKKYWQIKNTCHRICWTLDTLAWSHTDPSLGPWPGHGNQTQQHTAWAPRVALNILTICSCSFILTMNNKYKSITQDSIRFPKAIKTFFQVECAADQTPQPTTLAKLSGGWS